MKSVYVKLLTIIFISFLGIIIYSNTFHCSFHLDDLLSIVGNSSIRNITNLQDIWNFWPCRFLTYLTFAFNYHFHQLDVFGYHLVSLVIHLGSAILVWWLTLLTLSTPAMKESKITAHANLIALFAGLIFVSHPLQTQAVTYIVQRAASMATLFYLASLCFYVKSRLLQDKTSISSHGTYYYIGSLIAAIAAMFSKEMAITLPLMIVLYEFSFLRAERRIYWRSIVPFLLTLFILPLTMFLTKSANSISSQEMQRALEGATDISSMQYFLTQWSVEVTYIRLLFLPLNQNLDYDYPIAVSIFDLPIFISFLFLAAILFLAQRLFSRYRLVSFSIFWFFLTLLPESSFFPIQDVIFEHRLYLPMVGYSLFLVSAAYYLSEKRTLIMMVMALTMVITCNSVLTYQRNKVWKDDFTLWDDVVKKSPYKARPYNYRGVFCYNQKEFTQAISDFTRAIEIYPEFVDAYNNRGNVYDKQGKFSQAIADYTKVIEKAPKFPPGYFNRGLAYFKQNLLTQALLDFTKTIEMRPRFIPAYEYRALIYVKQGNFTQAIDDLTKIIEIDPHAAAPIYINRSIIYYQLKDYDKSWADVHKAEALGYAVDPGSIAPLKKDSGRDE